MMLLAPGHTVEARQLLATAARHAADIRADPDWDTRRVHPTLAAHLHAAAFNNIDRYELGNTMAVRDPEAIADAGELGSRLAFPLQPISTEQRLDACAGQRRRSCSSRGDSRRLVPVCCFTTKVFAYYGGAVSIGVDVDDGTGWGEVNQLLDANRSRTASPPGGSATNDTRA